MKRFASLFLMALLGSSSSFAELDKRYIGWVKVDGIRYEYAADRHRGSDAFCIFVRKGEILLRYGSGGTTKTLVGKHRIPVDHKPVVYLIDGDEQVELIAELEFEGEPSKEQIKEAAGNALAQQFKKRKPKK